MKTFAQMTAEELRRERDEARAAVDAFASRGLKLNMTRGVPSTAQLDLSGAMQGLVTDKTGYLSENGTDCRTYGLPDGLPELRAIFAELLEVPASQVVAWGNSSLNLMFDMLSQCITQGTTQGGPWGKQGEVKFLCPSPGYDRHFSVTEYFGVTMIPVAMTPTGPDMDEVERLVSGDHSIKGMWCVPKYSNPQGVTYSDETVRRLARMPAADDFRIFWDNAYFLHDLADQTDALLNILPEAAAAGHPDRVFQFAATAKITYAGAGVAFFASSEANVAALKKRLTMQSICPDKVNQLRHARFFGSAAGVLEHMQGHRAILAPKFQAVLDALDTLDGSGIVEFTRPHGGYFVSVDVPDGCAKRVVALCAEGGVALTGAGATYPYGKDPRDRNIRIAPTFPPVDELKLAMELFVACVRLAAAEKQLTMDN